MFEALKPGIKTSEFGFAGVVGALTVFNDKLANLSPEQLWALVILAVAYMISRALVKIWAPIEIPLESEK